MISLIHFPEGKGKEDCGQYSKAKSFLKPSIQFFLDIY